MAFRTVLASLLLAQSALGQCLGRLPPALPTPVPLCASSGVVAADVILAEGFGRGIWEGFSAAPIGVASNGGAFSISSVSPGAPVGLTVRSENAYEGILAANGNLPFLGSVVIEGAFPSAGMGAVAYGCGDGETGMTSEGPSSTGITIPGALFPPTSPNAAATADALALVSNSFGYRGPTGYSIPRPGHHGLGCGCSTIY